MSGNPLDQLGLSRRAQAETGDHESVDLMSPATGVDVHEQRTGGTAAYGNEIYGNDSPGVLDRHPSIDANIPLFDPAIFDTQQYPLHTHAQDERADGLVYNAGHLHTAHQGPLAASQPHHGPFNPSDQHNPQFPSTLPPPAAHNPYATYGQPSHVYSPNQHLLILLNGSQRLTGMMPTVGPSIYGTGIMPYQHPSMRPSARGEVNFAHGSDTQEYGTATRDDAAYPSNNDLNERRLHPEASGPDSADSRILNDGYGSLQYFARQHQAQSKSAVQGPAPKQPCKSRAKSSRKRRAAKTLEDSDDGGDNGANDANDVGDAGEGSAILPFIRVQPTTSKVDAAARGIREPEPPLQNSGRYFNTYDEAVHGTNPPGWMPPANDVVLRNDAEMSPYVDNLTAAILNMSNILDNGSITMRNRFFAEGWQKGDGHAAEIENAYYPKHVFERLAWEIVRRCQQLHLRGPEAIFCLDPGIQAMSFAWSGLTFDERINILIDVLTQSKNQVKNLLRGDALGEFLLVPGNLLKNTMSYLKNNEIRAKVLKKHMGEYRDANHLPKQGAHGRPRSKMDVDGESGDEASSDPEPEPMRKGLGKGKVKNEAPANEDDPSTWTTKKGKGKAKQTAASDDSEEEQPSGADRTRRTAAPLHNCERRMSLRQRQSTAIVDDEDFVESEQDVPADDDNATSDLDDADSDEDTMYAPGSKRKRSNKKGGNTGPKQASTTDRKRGRKT